MKAPKYFLYDDGMDLHISEVHISAWGTLLSINVTGSVGQFTSTIAARGNGNGVIN